MKKPKKVRAPETPQHTVSRVLPRHTYNKRALRVGVPTSTVGYDLVDSLNWCNLRIFWKDAVINILVHDVLYDMDMVIDGSLFQYAEDVFYELSHDGTLVGVPDDQVP